jgi:hypothetical protein
MMVPRFRQRIGGTSRWTLERRAQVLQVDAVGRLAADHDVAQVQAADNLLTEEWVSSE